ncbi:hypothetical protein AJ79_09187 [Helicocarpus griseus UAMH5409]|uniref:Homeobox and C2H2 transcription factor n=1 Tax=Helicocarpus griseus UAMH5409 TaxID=1447875 RepID=A0A2B7WLT7_9EURO|nr:hypothetical protein AJ79_09187 [Helicocarpus griseus UAMH5409]
MEYFDFEQAAQDDDAVSDCPAIDESDVAAKYDSLRFDNELGIPTDPPTLPLHDAEERESSLSDKGFYPITQAKEPCDLCRARGLDCFMAKRGVMQNNGCTCCISLYRECSFTRTKPHEKGLDTLHVVSEDSYVPVGGVTGKKALRSFNGGATGAAFDDGDSRGRKSGARFSREAIRVLRTWLSEHANHPYPTDAEKDELKLKTNLKRSQICNWLANARRRGKVRPIPRDSSPPPTGALDIPRKQLAPGVDISDLTPLERWKYSPPEHEPASATAIIRAMANAPYSSDMDSSSGSRVGSHSRNTGSSNDGSNFSNRILAQSASSYSIDTKSSISDMSFASAFSHRSSRGSFTSADTKERRRRRHKSAVGQNTFQKARAARIFQCTFCPDSFSTKYDWQRHEKSLHLALDKWTCTPQGGIISLDGAMVCAFCKSPDPDADHLESHNFTACQEKSVQERTFYRKDHLSQHLRLMHAAKIGPWMESWKSATTEIKSRCGFCSSTFNTWKDRVDHLTAHFKAGTDMSRWQGDWGFEPHVAQRVENGIPPYLIAQERNSVNPFIASSAPPKKPSYSTGTKSPNPGSANESYRIPVPGDANCFRRLQVELSAYIGRQVGRGIFPTDSELQNEARMIAYGCDDPWNQTCADNPIWLSILKRDNGLCNLPEAENIHMDDLNMQPPFAAPGLSRPPAHSLNMPPDLVSSVSYSPGLQSPAFYSNGFNSGAPSVQGSFIDSVTESAGYSTGVSGGWPSLTTANALSSSAPVSAGFGPAITTGSDSQYFQQPMGNLYGDLGATFDGMHIDGFEPGTDQEITKNGVVNRSPSGPPPSYKYADSAPIDVPSSRPAAGSHISSGSFEPCFRNIFDEHFEMN